MAVRTLSDDEQYTIPECILCMHTSGPTALCEFCQPVPELKRCRGCYRRGSVVVSATPPEDPPAVPPPGA